MWPARPERALHLVCRMDAIRVPASVPPSVARSARAGFASVCGWALTGYPHQSRRSPAGHTGATLEPGGPH